MEMAFAAMILFSAVVGLFAAIRLFAGAVFIFPGSHKIYWVKSSSSGWEITSGTKCYLSTVCTINGALHINNGTLAIGNTGVLALSNGNKVIIDNAATSKLIIESGGKLVLNK